MSGVTMEPKFWHAVIAQSPGGLFLASFRLASNNAGVPACSKLRFRTCGWPASGECKAGSAGFKEGK